MKITKSKIKQYIREELAIFKKKRFKDVQKEKNIKVPIKTQ
jgi:hypothetical protein